MVLSRCLVFGYLGFEDLRYPQHSYLVETIRPLIETRLVGRKSSGIWSILPVFGSSHMGYILEGNFVVERTLW